MPRILITGATGLIGSHAAALWTERGWRVRALVRPRAEVAFLESLGCELVIGDLTEPATIRGSADGCDVVLHAAALLGVRAEWEAFRAANVDATSSILAESLARGVPRFLHVSTAAVYGPPYDQPRLPIDEGCPTDIPVREGAFYTRSKRMAESVVRAAPTGRMTWSILRPDVVMGERDRHFTRQIVEIARLPVLPLAGRGDNPLPVVYAGNVALALWLAAEKEAAGGRAYNVVGDGRLTQRELFEIASFSRDGPRFVALPPWLMRAAAAVSEGVFAVSGRRSVFTRDRVWFVANADPFDGSRLGRELGWDPPVSASEGWRRSVEWHRQAAVRPRRRKGAGL